MKPRIALAIWSIGLVWVGLFGLAPTPAQATSGIDDQMNFQGRLLTASGAVVADGNYNVEFKIYAGGTGTTANNGGVGLQWTEDWLNHNGAGQGVNVKNGYFSVQLGSITGLPSSVTLDQTVLWLSMTVASGAGPNGPTSTTCTTFSGCNSGSEPEMLPMKPLAATPFALNADNANALGGLTSGQFVQFGQGTVQSDTTSTNSAIFLNKTLAGNLIELQKSSVDVFNVDNTGDILFGNNTTTKTLSVTTAAAATVGTAIQITAGQGGSGTGSNGGALTLQGGASGGTTASGGNVTLDGGTGTSVANDGQILIGGTVDSAVTIGKATGTSTLTVGQSTATNTISIGSAVTSSANTQTISIGNGAGAGTAINVNILSGVGTAGNGRLNLGNNTRVNEIDLGNINPAAARTINIGNDSVVTGNAFADTINIGTNPTTVAGGNAVHIADGTPTGVGTNTVTIGSIAALANTTTIQGGVNSTTPTVSIQAAAAGFIAVGTANANTLQIGAVGAVANADTLHIADSNGATQAITIGGSGATGGSAAGTTVKLQGGATSELVANAGVTIQTFTNSTTGLVVENTGSHAVVSVDTSTNSGQGQLVLGAAGTNNTALVFNDAAGGGTHTVSIIGPATDPAGNLALTLPLIGAASDCLQSTGTSSPTAVTLLFGACSAGSSLQGAYNTAPTASPSIDVNGSGSDKGVTVQNDNTNPITGELFGVHDKTASGLGTGLFTVSNTGAIAQKTTTNSTTAYQLQNSTSGALFTADTSNMRVGVNITYSSMGAVGTVTPSLPAKPVTPTITPTGGAATTYDYIIIAVTPTGESAPSSPGPTTTGAAVLSSTAFNTITWTAFATATSYYVYRTVGGIDQGLIGIASTTSFVDTGQGGDGNIPAAGGALTAGTYKYYVTAIDSAGGETSVSPEASQATTGTTLTINLSWAAVTGASGYRVYRTAINGATGTETLLGSTTNLFYTDNGLIPLLGNPLPSSNTAYVGANNASSSLQLAVGGNGSETGQLYVSGSVPAGAVGNVGGGDDPQGLYVQFPYAYVTNELASSLQIYDISNPASPVALGSAGTEFNNATREIQPEAVYVAGKYAYVDDTNGGMSVIDISNPADPILVGGVDFGSGAGGSGIYVQGHYAYISDNLKSDLRIVDISNPTNPILVTTQSTGGSSNPTTLIVQGRYAYVDDTGGTPEIRIYDISNPAAGSLPLVGTILGSFSDFRLAIQGRYLYAPLSTGSLEIIDVSNPAAPVSISTVATGASPNDVYVQGRYVYVSNGSVLQTIDVSNPVSPVSVGSVATSSGLDVFVEGRYAYVTTISGVQVFDVGGTYTQQLEAGGIQTDTLQTSGDVGISGDASVQGGLAVGSSLNVTGSTSIGGGLTVSTGATNQAGALQVLTSTGGQAFDVDNTTANLIANPDFNSNITTAGWVATGSGTPAIAENTTVADIYSSNGSLSVTTGTSANSGAKATAFTTAPTPNTYTLSFYATGGTAITDLSAVVTGGGAPTCTLQTNGAANNTINTAGFVRYSCSFTTTSTNITAITIGVSGTTPQTFFLDGVSLVVGGTLTQYGVGNDELLGIVDSPVALKDTSNSTTAFQIQNASSSNMFTADTLDNQIVIGTGTTGQATPGSVVLLVLDNGTSTSAEPTEVNGAMYYSTAMAEFRCGENGFWSSCGVNDIQHSFNFEDEFPGGAFGNAATATPLQNVGSLGWEMSAVLANCAVSYNSPSGLAGSHDHPGSLQATTGNAASGDGCLLGDGSAVLSWVMGAGDDIKTTVDLSQVTSGKMRVGMDNVLTSAVTANASGAWFEYDTGTLHWQYCYGIDTTTPTCANTTDALTLSTWYNLEIRIISPTAITYILTPAGGSPEVHALTGISPDIGVTNHVEPLMACWSTTTSTETCNMDYFQYSGYTTATGGR